MASTKNHFLPGYHFSDCTEYATVFWLVNLMNHFAQVLHNACVSFPIWPVTHLIFIWLQWLIEIHLHFHDILYGAINVAFEQHVSLFHGLWQVKVESNGPTLCENLHPRYHIGFTVQSSLKHRNYNIETTGIYYLISCLRKVYYFLWTTLSSSLDGVDHHYH